ncbi:MAG: 6-phosphogluconolactonase [Anaerolineales bacterium]|nr:6-phosphogluconolactonase [Anaerolineales bacterium]
MSKVFKVFPSTEELYLSLIEKIENVAEESITKRGFFSLALSGGNTPRDLYSLLSQPEYSRKINWGKVQIFWGDERTVPPSDTGSNYLMAYEALLKLVPIPAQNIHRMRGEGVPGISALRYEQDLVDTLGDPPILDMIHLGMGDDGHTASLFPGTAALVETERWVVKNYVEKLNTWRLSLTAACINYARHVEFIVIGKAKAKILEKVLEGEYLPQTYPSQLIHLRSGTLSWWLDKEAAAELRKIK